ncbi:MAG TPA: AraC family transcriptional regulator [Puia sp.]|nr:AraC family transcriptional regulator [Puia sp.]
MRINGIKHFYNDDFLRIEQAIIFIETNYRNKINTIQLSVEVNISQRKLIAGIKQRTNLTIEQLIQKVRVDKAKQLLEENTYPLKLIAKYTGFRDQSYFGKVFKKHVAMTPEEYRAATKQNYYSKIIEKGNL